MSISNLRANATRCRLQRDLEPAEQADRANRGANLSLPRGMDGAGTTSRPKHPRSLGREGAPDRTTARELIKRIAPLDQTITFSHPRDVHRLEARAAMTVGITSKRLCLACSSGPARACAEDGGFGRDALVQGLDGESGKGRSSSGGGGELPVLSARQRSATGGQPQML